MSGGLGIGRGDDMGILDEILILEEGGQVERLSPPPQFAVSRHVV